MKSRNICCALFSVAILMVPLHAATISGIVTLDGGTGNVTNALVAADGIGNPTTHPSADGSYELTDVEVGARVITASLAGYDVAWLNVTLTAAGLTNQNVTIRRLPPPAPVGLVAVLNSITGRDSLWWSYSPDLLVDGYKVYRRMRDSTIWNYRKTVYSRMHNWAIDTLTGCGGIWMFSVSAIDTGVMGGTANPLESPRSDPTPPQIFGLLPPVSLSANGNFDNRIQLNWLAPGTPPNSGLYTEKKDHRGRHSLDQAMYIIYRDGARRDSVEEFVTTYNDTSLPENQVHQYYVTARYDNVTESCPSNTVSAACNMPPAAPTNITCTPVNGTQTRIGWSAPSTNADGTPLADLAGYCIYRNGSQIGQVAASTNQYIDTPPDPTTHYIWMVKAYDDVPNLSVAASVDCWVVPPWYATTYDWVDISDIGSPTGMTSEDSNGGPFDLGFAFPFCDGEYTQVYANANGIMSFAPITGSNNTNTCIPDTAVPNCALYPFWDDLSPNAGGIIKYLADTTNHRFIMSWLGVPRYGTADYQTFEVVIEQNGAVTYNYQTIGVNDECTVGVENCDGTDGLQVACSGEGLFLPMSETAIQFWGGPPSGITGVVRALSPSIPIADCAVYAIGQPDTDRTDAGGSYSINVRPGTYTVCFRHAQYCDTCYAGVVVVENTTTTRNATLRQALATLSVTSINRVVPIGQVRTDSFSIRNTGGPCALTFTVADSANWISESPASGAIPSGATQWIRYTIGPIMQPGYYVTSIMVYFNSTGSPYRIPVTLIWGDPGAVQDPELLLPTVFALHANYPNPFNATTVIPFDIPRDSRVDIVIYNLMGQEVARPVGGAYPAGRYQAHFDATNLSSGVYVIRMNAGDFSQLGKMMLLK